MNEQDYQLLIDLYETKNITKVADQHFLTQPALTKRLRRIEEELGSVLLVRSRKGVVFNSVGESVISYCRQMCEMNEQLRNSKLSTTTSSGGLILALQRAITTARPEGRYRKHCYWLRYKAVLLESSLLESSACSLIYFCTASSVILPIVST